MREAKLEDLKSIGVCFLGQYKVNLHGDDVHSARGPNVLHMR